MVKVSVIIPVWNGEKYICEAIDSVLNQTFRDFEVVVVDDGSKDRTVKFLGNYGDKIRWFSKEHKNQAAAENEGVKMARGEYIAYIDADDVCLPKRLEISAGYLDAHPEVGLVYSDYELIDKQGKIIGIRRVRTNDNLLLLQNNYITRSTVMHRRKCLDWTGLFDESISGSDDFDMWVRISEKFALGYINKPLLKFRVYESSTSQLRQKNFEWRRYAHMKILEKSYERRGRPFSLRIQIIWIRARWKILGIQKIATAIHPFYGRSIIIILAIWEMTNKILFYLFWKKICR